MWYIAFPSHADIDSSHFLVFDTHLISWEEDSLGRRYDSKMSVCNTLAEKNEDPCFMCFLASLKYYSWECKYIYIYIYIWKKKKKVYKKPFHLSYFILKFRYLYNEGLSSIYWVYSLFFSLLSPNSILTFPKLL